jgi:lipopolysaccharide export system ATP-binding protein
MQKEMEFGSEADALLVELDSIVKVYKGRTVVDKVSMNVRAGEIVGLLGPNGAGKTTTFYSVIGLIKPDGGSVKFKGSEVTQLPMYKRARLGMGYLAQEPSVFRKLSVSENVMAVLETMDLSHEERVRKRDELLADLALTKLSDQKAYTLSGGERRKLEITRALVSNPDIIMLDEPFSGVDPLAVNDIQEIIRELAKRGLGILITDHNVRETLAVVDRAYLLYEGKVLREGESEFLINDEMSRELYLGKEFSM